MVDIAQQLIGAGVSPAQMTPEKAAGSGHAPDTAVSEEFGNLLAQAQASSHAPAQDAPEQPTGVSTPPDASTANADASSDVSDQNIALQLQLQAQLQAPPATEELPATELPEAPDADVPAQAEASKTDFPGTLVGSDDAHAVSADVSVTVKADGTDATGLTGLNAENSAPEKASDEETSQTATSHDTASSVETSTPVESQENIAYYHPVFEAPRTNLGKPVETSQYASRPEKPEFKLTLPTGLMTSQGKPQAEKFANVTAAHTTEAQTPLVEPAFTMPLTPGTQNAQQHVPMQAHISAESSVLMAKPHANAPEIASQNTAEAANTGTGFETALSTATTSQQGMDLGSQLAGQNAASGEAFADLLAVNVPADAAVSVPVAELTALGAEVQSVSTQPAGVSTDAEGLPVFTSSAVEISDQVVEATRYGVENGQKSLVLKLNPDNLGEVRLHLTSNAKQEVSAKLIVENLGTLDTLNTQVTNLKQSLESHGLTVGKISVIMAGGAEFNANSGSSGNNNQQQSSNNNQSQNSFWSSAGGNNPQQQGSFHQSAQAMFNQMMNNGNGSGHAYQGFNGNFQQTPVQDDAAWGTPHNQAHDGAHENGRVSLLV